MLPDSTDTFLLFKEFCNSASQTVQCLKYHHISKYAGKFPLTKALWHNALWHKALQISEDHASQSFKNWPPETH